MPQNILERIREAIRSSNYDITKHANDEMAEDNLSIYDVEHSVLAGSISKTEHDDARGPRYTIIGDSADAMVRVGVVGRFKETGTFLIITVYAVD